MTVDTGNDSYTSVACRFYPSLANVLGVKALCNQHVRRGFVCLKSDPSFVSSRNAVREEPSRQSVTKSNIQIGRSVTTGSEENKSSSHLTTASCRSSRRAASQTATCNASASLIARQVRQASSSIMSGLRSPYQKAGTYGCSSIPKKMFSREFSSFLRSVPSNTSRWEVAA